MNTQVDLLWAWLGSETHQRGKEALADLEARALAALPDGGNFGGARFEAFVDVLGLRKVIQNVPWTAMPTQPSWCRRWFAA